MQSDPSRQEISCSFVMAPGFVYLSPRLDRRRGLLSDEAEIFTGAAARLWGRLEPCWWTAEASDLQSEAETGPVLRPMACLRSGADPGLEDAIHDSGGEPWAEVLVWSLGLPELTSLWDGGFEGLMAAGLEP
ncbi:hypothetical protein NDU88_010630 [Pleurodeles waltl]|uniref:Uncharacterized protein n=1 Tax=Pleurodeles waltl TaxID=8319 RepID=A0AAV7QWF2_PLEWA|nr:hypothetical protein NDU88_010630 [Pleurodeles waltl]